MRKIKDCVRQYEVGDKTPKYSVYLFRNETFRNETVVICTKNGSLIKDKLCLYAKKDKKQFSELRSSFWKSFGRIK